MCGIFLFSHPQFRKGGLAQLARALAWHARGHRFDSDILHKKSRDYWRDFSFKEENILSELNCTQGNYSKDLFIKVKSICPSCEWHPRHDFPLFFAGSATLPSALM
jgi:hypothetical protein